MDKEKQLQRNIYLVEKRNQTLEEILDLQNYQQTISNFEFCDQALQVQLDVEQTAGGIILLGISVSDDKGRQLKTQ